MIPPVISPAASPLPRGDGSSGFDESFVCGVASVAKGVLVMCF
jgi:hypothetical protein